MKTLLLIRHAKSSWDFPYLSDELRPLGPRGKSDAPRVGKHLNQLGIKPDIMLSSPAVRAKSTAFLIANELRFPTDKIEIVEEFYTFGDNGDTILNKIRDLKESLQTAIVFGHNETFHYLAGRLSKGVISEFPTCAVCIALWEVSHWSEINSQNVVEHQFFSPKLIS